MLCTNGLRCEMYICMFFETASDNKFFIKTLCVCLCVCVSRIKVTLPDDIDIVFVYKYRCSIKIFKSIAALYHSELRNNKYMEGKKTGNYSYDFSM